MSQHWERLGLVLKPDPNCPWLKTHAGPACAVLVNSSIADLYVTGRDSENRSLIGRVRIDINNPKDLLEISMAPVLGLGQLGAFDENGVAYPTIIHHQGAKWMYYVGWMPARLTPFQVNVGLAIEKSPDRFVRYSRAPILARNNEDFLGTASSFIAREGDRWRLWYTSFYDWGQRGQPLHRYHIKHAYSIDGINWRRDNQVCIQARNEEEIAINRPSVLRIGKHYHMWYCVRGTHYRIGYAVSGDGVRWRRRDSEFDLPTGDEKWDAIAQAYPHVICLSDYLYMFYCGNDYGREGLGLARLPVAALSRITI